MQPDDTTPVTTVAHPAQQSDLARLHLDCLIAMPWNKLYRRTYARQLAFDQAYTLGEDLQFVLDYLALLGRCQPDFSYLVLESALTFTIAAAPAPFPPSTTPITAKFGPSILPS